MKIIKYQIATEIPTTVIVQVPLYDEDGSLVMHEVKKQVLDTDGNPVVDENGEFVYETVLEPVLVDEVRHEMEVILKNASISCPTDEVLNANLPMVQEVAYNGVYTIEDDGVTVQILAPYNITAGEYVTINGVLYLVTENIPNGEPVITGQNAIATTIEKQLYELKGE